MPRIPIEPLDSSLITLRIHDGEDAGGCRSPIPDPNDCYGRRRRIRGRGIRLSHHTYTTSKVGGNAAANLCVLSVDAHFKKDKVGTTTEIPV